MGARSYSWQQQIKAHPIVSVLATLVIALIVLVIIGGYLLHWDWAGFNGNIKSGKTLWDWLQLLIIPAVLAFGVSVIYLTISRGEQEATKQRAKTEREVADDNQREAALQGYIDKISELLLHEKLRESQQTDEVRTLARVRTLTVLPRLDGKHKGSVLQFLHEAKLINQDKGIVSLEGANLREANLSGANLYKADLFGAELTECLLNKANLIETNLSNANLSNAGTIPVHLET